MASHSVHPPIHTDGLADGCERCGEQAKHPFEMLDDPNLQALVDRTRLWQRNDREGDPRSENERAAIVEQALLWRLQLDKLDLAREKAAA